ncbi:MAG TPA: VanZ family protein [Candidatus Binatia bacterium]|nr:VanZ family protein [Candidatus Binatia bacterium]
MKRYQLSALYILALLLTSPFHVQVINFLVKGQGFYFTSYVLLGIMAAFFALGFFRAFRSGQPQAITAILLAAAIVAYFLFQRRIFLNKAFFSNFLHIAEFFMLGTLLSRENKKTSSPLPLIILFASAFAFELSQVFFHNRVVDGNDIWINMIAGLVGLTTGFFWPNRGATGGSRPEPI